MAKPHKSFSIFGLKRCKQPLIQCSFFMIVSAHVPGPYVE